MPQFGNSCYEAFALWSSPWLTAWLIIGYFAAALLTDSLFPVGTFCRYVCPLGNFNFALSGASPTIIRARDARVCASCTGKYCVNGRETTAEGTLDLTGLQTLPMLQTQPLAAAASQGTFPGCETRLYVPTITTNQDCTLCLNCLRACPHDNVALVVRNPLRQALTERPRPDLALLLTLLAWAGVLNAFAMTPSYFLLAQWLSGVLHTRNAPLLLALILLGGLGTGTGLSLLVAHLGRTSLRQTAPLLVPLALALWGGHYLYHFLLGASTLWPAVAHALMRLGIPLLSPAAPTIPRPDHSPRRPDLLAPAGAVRGGAGRHGLGDHPALQDDHRSQHDWPVQDTQRRAEPGAGPVLHRPEHLDLRAADAGEAWAPDVNRPLCLGRRAESEHGFDGVQIATAFLTESRSKGLRVINRLSDDVP